MVVMSSDSGARPPGLNTACACHVPARDLVPLGFRCHMRKSLQHEGISSIELANICKVLAIGIF